MKVSIIGGGGLVGSSAAFALQCGGVVSHINLIDLNADQARGQALDLLHGASLVADQRIRATGYEAIPESDVVIITAGLRRKPDEPRLALINRNVDLFVEILTQASSAGLKRDAKVLVVSNPVDVLTYLAVKRLDLPAGQVIGLGTQLDTARFRSLIAEAIDVPPTQVSGLILGEHGDSMVPIWSTAQAGGLPLERFPKWTPGLAEAIIKRTRGSGAEVISLKGGAGFAVGVSIREVVHSIALGSGPHPAGVVAGERPVRAARRVHLGADCGGKQRRGRSSRDRAVAQGSLGPPAFGRGPARDDRRGGEKQSKAAASSAALRREGSIRASGSNHRGQRVTMGSGRGQRAGRVIPRHRVGAGQREMMVP